jgi:hypothetical protein
MSQKKKILQQKILQAPVAIRSMRKSIIENANFLIEEMRQHDFTEVSEIVRACTALGIRRAFLRGLQHPVASEGDINKFIHRFNMLGTLPFQDQNEPSGSKNVALVLVEDDYMTTHTQSYAIIGGYSSSDNALTMIKSVFPSAPVTFVNHVGSNPKTDIKIGTQTFSGNPNITPPSYFDNFTGGVFQLSNINAGSGSIVNRDPIADFIAANASGYVFEQTSGNRANKINNVYITAWEPIAGAGKPFWVGGGNFAERAFNYYVNTSNKKTKSVMVEALTLEGDVFAVIDGSEVAFTASNKPILPTTAFIPKYRASGNDSDLPWLPYMKCSLLNEIPDTENCVSATDVTTGSIDRPDLNLLVPFGTNQFPFSAPNSGMPYLKKVNPEPKSIRMVLDGSPIDGENVVIQNRFLLSGATKIAPGDPGDGTIRNPVGGGGLAVFTPGPGDNPGPGDDVIVDGTIRFTLVPGEDPNLLYVDREVNDYSGPVLYVRDPVKGTNTKFTEELKAGNVIEILFPNRILGGTFYTVGESTLYYAGTDFIKKYHNNIRINIENVQYVLSSQTIADGQYAQDQFSFNYNSTYTIASRTILDDTINSIFDSVNQQVTVYSNPVNSTICDVHFQNVDSNYVKSHFEVGDTIFINSIPYAFQSIEGKILHGAYRTDLGSVDSELGSWSLRRDAKQSRSSNVNVGGALPEFRIFYQVSKVNNDTEIEITPPHEYDETFEGHIYRIGFNIETNAHTPDMLNSGFDREGVGQFRLFNTSTNAYAEDSPTFYIPKAVNNRVILYQHPTDFTKAPASMSAKPVHNVLKGVDKFFTSEPHDYKTFSALLANAGLSFGELVYTEDYTEIDKLIKEQHVGSITFTDGNDDYITLETLENDSPVSHNFAEGDRLTIRSIRKEPLPGDDPYGDCISHRNSTYLHELDYDHCGLQMEVQEIVDVHRFTVLRKGFNEMSQANYFFHSYDVNPTHYLTATNGGLVEYWAKYFKTVFMDGTVNANSITYATSTETSKIAFGGKGTSDDTYKWNYNMAATQFTHYIGSSGIEVNMTGDHFIRIDNVAETEDGTFILSLDHSLTAPPRLLDSYFLRNAEFDEIPLT